MKIAYLEDDAAHVERVQTLLTDAGHVCETFDDGAQLIRALKRTRYDMLLLDWQVPGVTGHELTVWARANLNERLPIIFMTSRSLETDIVSALRAGADDYMIKPIRQAELLARIEALARRAQLAATAAQTAIELGRYRIDTQKRSCTFDDAPIELTSREFDLVALLFQHVGRVVSREYIGGTLWGQSSNAISRTLDTHMSRVRAKLNLRPENGVRLTPVYGHGYRLDLVAESTDSSVENLPPLA